MIALVRGVIAASSSRRVHREGAGIDVDEHRRRAGVADRRHGRDEGERHGDHLVARADAGGEQRQVQRAGAGVDADAVRRAAVGGELLLEGRDLAAEGELAATRARAAIAGVDLGLDARGTAPSGRRTGSRRSSPGAGCRRSRRVPRIELVAASSSSTTRSPSCPSVCGALAVLDAVDEVLALDAQRLGRRRAAAPTCRRCGSRRASGRSASGRR